MIDSFLEVWVCSSISWYLLHENGDGGLACSSADILESTLYRLSIIYRPLLITQAFRWSHFNHAHFYYVLLTLPFIYQPHFKTICILSLLSELRRHLYSLVDSKVCKYSSIPSQPQPTSSSIYQSPFNLNLIYRLSFKFHKHFLTILNLQVFIYLILILPAFIPFGHSDICRHPFDPFSRL